jgi:hypothetical protein
MLKTPNVLHFTVKTDEMGATLGRKQEWLRKE